MLVQVQAPGQKRSNYGSFENLELERLFELAYLIVLENEFKKLF